MNMFVNLEDFVEHDRVKKSLVVFDPGVDDQVFPRDRGI